MEVDIPGFVRVEHADGTFAYYEAEMVAKDDTTEGDTFTRPFVFE